MRKMMVILGGAFFCVMGCAGAPKEVGDAVSEGVYTVTEQVTPSTKIEGPGGQEIAIQPAEEKQVKVTF